VTILAGLTWASSGLSSTSGLIGVLLGALAFLALGVGLLFEHRALRRRIRFPAPSAPPASRGWTWTEDIGFIFATWGTFGLVSLLLEYAEGGFTPGSSSYYGGFPLFGVVCGFLAAVGWTLLLRSELVPRRRAAVSSLPPMP
jgi:hypothetical protein